MPAEPRDVIAARFAEQPALDREYDWADAVILTLYKHGFRILEEAEYQEMNQEAIKDELEIERLRTRLDECSNNTRRLAAENIKLLTAAEARDD